MNSHRLNNLVHALLLVVGMAGLLALVGWTLAGPAGGVLGLVFAVGLALFSPTISPALILRMYRAARAAPSDFPALFAVLEELCRRAGLSTMPAVYYVPSRMMNAFSVGGRGDAAIALTDGLLRGLNDRELVGVLAHEISHIRHSDMWIMSVADSVSRLVRMMSLFGQVLLLVNLPLVLMNRVQVSWLLIIVLILAPTASALLQLALSRNREFDADLEAVRLTGDPKGLAAALERLERAQGSMWERIVFSGPRIPDPSLLRTHPKTEERVRRLLALTPEEPEAGPVVFGRRSMPDHLPEVERHPGRRWHGTWY